MSQRTDAQLTTEKEAIKNETVANANSANRIGTMVENMIDSKVNNDKIETANTLNTSGKTVAGRDAVKAYIDNLIAGLGPNHFKGVFASEAALEAAFPTADEGDYAFVDTGGTDASLYIWDDTDTDWVESGVTTVVPDATETVKGIIEIATQAETNTGTDDVRALTPLKLNAKLRATRTVTGADSIIQIDDNSLIIFNSASPFNFTVDQLTASSKLSYVNIGAGAVTLVAGTGVTITGRTVIPGAVSNDFPGGLIFWGTATAVRTITGEEKEPDVVTTSTAGSTITFDMALKYTRMFIGSAPISTPKTIALINDSAARVIPAKLNLSNLAGVLTFPTSFTMFDARWNDTNHEFTPSVVGVHEFSATNYGDGEWLLKVHGPYP